VSENAPLEGYRDPPKSPNLQGLGSGYTGECSEHCPTRSIVLGLIQISVLVGFLLPFMGYTCLLDKHDGMNLACWDAFQPPKVKQTCS
jgi:hypothetical protein